jgi:hypothetical protein
MISSKSTSGQHQPGRYLHPEVATPIAGRGERQGHSVDFVKFRESLDGRKKRTALIARNAR